MLGTPVSQQTNDRALLRTWRGIVRATAQERWPAVQPPLDSPLKITVVCYYDGRKRRFDNDNLLKPLQDALIGLVYRDDDQITDCVVRKTSINGAFFVRGMPYLLLEAIARGQEFVHRKIEMAPDHREILR